MALIGVVMVYLSLKSDKFEIHIHSSRLMDETIRRANDSKKLIKFTVIIALLIIGVLYITSLFK